MQPSLCTIPHNHVSVINSYYKNVSVISSYYKNVSQDIGEGFGTRFASVSSLATSRGRRREERAWPLVVAAIRTPPSATLQSTHFPCSSVTCPLSLHHHAALPCLSNSILWISLPTPTPLLPPQKHLTSPRTSVLHQQTTASASASSPSPLRAYSLTSLSPARRRTGSPTPRGIALDQRNTTKRSSIRHPRARCRYRASRHSPLREIAVPPDLQWTTGKPKRKDLQHRTSPQTHIF
jgi:hypothetical protein